jgi:hypothetical protein
MTSFGDMIQMAHNAGKKGDPMDALAAQLGGTHITKPKPKKTKVAKKQSVSGDDNNSDAVSETSNVEIMVDTIHLFKSMKGSGKKNNDSYNRKREEILRIIRDTYTYDADATYGNQWKVLREKFNSALDQIFNTYSPASAQTNGYDRITLVKLAGRGNNYDFDCMFYKGELLVWETRLEFKCGMTSPCKKITELTQYLNADANKLWMTGYPEMFYDTVVSKHEIFKNHPSISKEEYLKHVMNSSSKHPFFTSIDTAYELNTDGFKTIINKLAKATISEFLKSHSKFQMSEFQAELLRTQKNKVFLLWNALDQQFYTDIFEDSELECGILSRIHLNNTIVITTKNSDSEHRLLLRWKNHIGILNPAWQIKLVRAKPTPAKPKTQPKKSQSK